MNYNRLYNSIISRAVNRQIDIYTERHHIIPRCLGGSDDNANLVNLTAKEHFVCHLLLTKMYPEGSNEWHKMIKAFMMMCCHSKHHYRYTGKIHEAYRERFSQVQSESQKGDKNSNFGTMWIYNLELKESKKISKTAIVPEGWEKGRVINFDKKQQQISHQQMRDSMTDAEKSQQKREKISRFRREQNALGISDETRQKMRDAKLGKSNSMKGKKHTAKARQNIAATDRTSSGMAGKKHTKETKQKISDAQKVRHALNHLPL